MSTLFSLLFLLVAGAYANTNNSVVPITVYYESLCGDSISFFLNKLIPTFTQTNFNFSNLFPSIILNPYGKVIVNNPSTNNYTCQHGKSECDGNRLHACAIKYITDEVLLLNYIGCLMTASNQSNKTLPYPKPEECGSKIAKIDVLSNITSCYIGEEGWTLFKNYGNKTNTFFNGITNISLPFIAFNNVYNSTLSLETTKNFRKTLCAEANVVKDVCTDSNGAAFLSASFTLISIVLFFVFARQ